jgi:hypothetical protein
MYFQTPKNGILSASSKMIQTRSNEKVVINRSFGFVHLEVVGGCALEVILLCRVSAHVYWFRTWMANFPIVMKAIVAAMYSKFSSSIVDYEGIEQDDGVVVSPKGNKLILKFHASSK